MEKPLKITNLRLEMDDGLRVSNNDKEDYKYFGYTEDEIK